jgi:RNA polymerase sigma factor (sigma-70 family)
MLEHLPQAVLRFIRIQAGSPSDSQSDAALVDQFIRLRSESAFAALLDRHGPMVLSVCRRILRDEHLAEDAFQATFLVLARKAGSIRKRAALASWLHGVALRLAHKLRVQTQRTEQPISPTDAPSVVYAAPRSEEHEILDEELARLPERYRLPLVLCYLEGRTHNEAALLLGWSAGQLRGLLDRGRERLRSRLVRRGITLSAVGALSAAVPSALAESTLKAAALFASGKTLAESGVAASTAGLVEGGLRMIGSKKAGVFVLLLLLASIGTGAALLARGGNGTDEEQPPAQPMPPEGKKDAVVVEQKQPRVVPDPLETPLPEGAVVRLGSTRFRTGGSVGHLHLSHDGKRLVANGTGAGLYVFDTATGKRILHCPVHADRGELSRDGERLFFFEGVQTGPKTWDAVLRVHALADGKLLKTIDGPRRPANFALSPDGRTMVVEYYEERQINFTTYVYKSHLELRELAGYRVLHTFGEQESPGPHNRLYFSPDGKSLFAVSTQVERKGPKSTVRRFDVATAALKSQFVIDGVHDAEPPVWNGKNLLAVGNKIWDLEKQRLHWSSKRELGTIQAFMPDGESVLGYFPECKIPQGDEATPLLQWDLETDREIRRWRNRGGTALILAADGKSCFIGDLNRVLRLDLATGKEITTVDAPIRSPWQVAFSPDQKYLATLDFYEMQVWDCVTGKRLHHESVAGFTPGPLRFTPDSKTLLYPGETKISTLDVGTWKHGEREFEGLVFVRGGANYCELSPDGKILAASVPVMGAPQAIRLWDSASGKQIGKLEHADKDKNVHHLGPLTFSADGKRLACLVYPLNRVQVWNVADRKLLVDWETKRDLLSLQFIEGGESLAGGFVPHPRPEETGPVPNGDDPKQGVVRVWNPATGKEKFRFQYDQPEYIGLPARFSPDGKLAATANRLDKFVRFWNLATGKEVGQFHAGVGIEGFLFSGDGRLLAVNATDATVLLVDVRRVVKK